MKKLLAASTALVAATAFAGAAQAADPIKLSLGGFGYGAVTYYDYDDQVLNNNEINNFVVTGDNEIHFKGSTTLDNGLSVAVKYELRAGGAGSGTGGAGAGASNVDEWSLTMSGGFGNIILGGDDIATEAVAIMAPHMGGRLLGAGLSEGSMIFGDFVPNAGVSTQIATFINSNDENQISYVSNEIAGFTFGASYVPGFGAGQDTGALAGGNTTVTTSTATGATTVTAATTGNVADVYGVGVLWAGEFSGVGVKAEAGYAVGDMSNQVNQTVLSINNTTGAVTATNTNTASTLDEWSQWQAGAGVEYAGFTVSGGYSKINQDLAVGSADSYAWEAGVGYQTGPYGVALGYYKSSVENGLNDDEAEVWQLTSQYTMGPGVMLAAGAALADFDDGEVGGNQNDGVVVQTGLMLSF